MPKFLAPLLCTLCLASLAHAQPQQPKRVRAGTLGPVIETKDDANIKLVTDKTQYSNIEPIKLTIALKNTGKKTFDILPMDVEWFYKIDVIGPDGKVLPFKKPRRSIYRALTTSPLYEMVQLEAIRPGETKNAMAWISNLFDMSAPGRYKINVTTNFLLGTRGDTIDINADPTIVEVTATPLSSWL